MTKPSKSELVREAFKKDPQASVDDVAKKAGLSKAAVYSLRSETLKGKTPQVKKGKLNRATVVRKAASKPRATEATQLRAENDMLRRMLIELLMGGLS